MTTLLAVQAAKTVVLLLVLLVAFRALGKRELSQFTLNDLAMLICLSNAVQNAMTAGSGSLLIGLAVSTSLVVPAWALTRTLVRAPSVERAIFGTPTLLVYDGRVLRKRMRRENVSKETLDAAIREVGVSTVADVLLAVLEIDGSLSIVPRSARTDR